MNNCRSTLTLVFLSFSIIQPSPAKDDIDKDVLKQIGRIELQVTGKAPGHESGEERLNCIELKLFGKIQPGSVFDRLDKIRMALTSASKSGNSNDDWPAFGTAQGTSQGASGAQNLQGVQNAPNSPNSQNSQKAQMGPVSTSPPPPSPGVNANGIIVSTPSPANVDSLSAVSDILPGVSQVAPGSFVPSQSAPANDISGAPDTRFKNQAEHAVPAGTDIADDGWPDALPRVTETLNSERGPLKVEVTENANAEDAEVQSLKNAPVEKVYQKGNEALDTGHYTLAQKLFNMLCLRSPKEPRFFYGAGMAFKMDGDYPNAFANWVVAWHLGRLPVYQQAVEGLVPVLQKSVDDQFKLTYGFKAEQPEAILNAGVRMWKANMTPQSVKLLEYALKNEPLYREVAAYNLGAIAEHNGDIKLAAEYYKWASKEARRLRGIAQSRPELAGAINDSLKLLPPNYLEAASADMQQTLLRGGLKQWNGWAQAGTRPQHWGSEVCPLCAISRTSLTYEPGQVTLK